MADEIWDAIIVGGGIAGCSAAIRLAGGGRRVLVLEQKIYPANKLCGEFLSCEAAGYLEEMGALAAVYECGSVEIRRTRITAMHGAEIASDLPGVALGISRRALDSALMARAEELGAVCRQGIHASDISGCFSDGFSVETAKKTYRSHLVFGAYGRNGKLAGDAARESPFLAFKTHYEGASECDEIALYAFDGGYVGVSPVEDGLLNACYILNRRALDAADGRAEDFFRMAARQNRALGERLAPLRRVDGLIGCSQISFLAKPKVKNGVCQIGDSAGMIAPLCGDGMSMAMRSAQLAADAAGDWLDGKVSFAQFTRTYENAWQREFRTRLFVGRLLQELSVSPKASNVLVGALRHLPGVAARLIGLTRGSAIQTTYLHPAKMAQRP